MRALVSSGVMACLGLAYVLGATASPLLPSWSAAGPSKMMSQSAVVAPLGPSATRFAPNTRELASQAAIKVTSRNCGARTSGTGFLVESESGVAVVTNQHVVGREDRIRLTSDDGEIELPVAKSDVGRDLAIAYLSPSQVGSIAKPALVMAPSPAAGTALVLAGYPGGDSLAVVDGTTQLSAPGSAYGFDAEVVLINGAAVPGMSGGPVLDDAGGLVGVVAAVDYTTGLVVAVSSLELSALLSADEPGQVPLDANAKARC